jgi:hypothetical protein
MGFTDKLKAKAAELGLGEKAQLAKKKAAAAADGNRGKIADAVQKAGATVNDKTGGKYADKVAKAQGAAMTGVDKVAATGTAAGARGTTTGDFGDTTVGSEEAIDRAIGQDGTKTADDQFGGESAVDRAVGADAPTSSLDPNTAFDVDNEPVTDPEINSVHGEADGLGENRTTTDGFGGDAGAHDVRNADVDNAAVTDPEINSVDGLGDDADTGEAMTDPEITALSGEAEQENAVRRVGDGLPEDGPHGDTLR